MTESQKHINNEQNDVLFVWLPKEEDDEKTIMLPSESGNPDRGIWDIDGSSDPYGFFFRLLKYGGYPTCSISAEEFDRRDDLDL